MTKLITLSPYNPDWPAIFETEARLIKEVLSTHCIEIHHIGSTSVPKLSAKKDIDILCVIDSLPNSLKLENSGYIFKGEFNIPLHYLFSKNTDFSKVNLHIVEKDHGFIEQKLLFRDYLRSNEVARINYENLKTNLVLDPKSHLKVDGVFTAYTLGKNDFIKSILEKAGFDGIIANFCLHHTEWEEYHRIREEQIFVPLGVVYDRNHPSFTDPNNYHFVLYKGTKIVTAALIELLNEKEASLRSLATDALYQGNGYGAYMVNVVEKWIKSKGRNIVKLHSRPSAESFYRRLGYVDMEFKDTCIAEDHIDLGKDL